MSSTQLRFPGKGRHFHKSYPFLWPPKNSLFLRHIHLPKVYLSGRNLKDCSFLLFTGPKLPIPLFFHAMVQLEKGQAIIGGFGDGSQDKIYLFSCMDRNCSIHQLSQELSVPRYWFVAIPIPDTLSGCITGGKKFHKIYHVNFQFKTYPNLSFFRVSAGRSCWGRLLPWLDQ